MGMIAQEVEIVIPDWVDVRTDGYKTVTQRGFEALTVEALRQLRAQHESEFSKLREENADRDKQIAVLTLLEESVKLLHAKQESQATLHASHLIRLQRQISALQSKVRFCKHGLPRWNNSYSKSLPMQTEGFAK